MADVLIVDDEEDICEFLCEALEDVGVKAKSVLTGEEALKLMEQEAFKICLVDLKLATAVTGLDVIKSARAKRSEMLIVAMSGYIDAGLKRNAEKLGANEYFEKPGDLKEDVFIERMRALLSKA